MTKAQLEKRVKELESELESSKKRNIESLTRYNNVASDIKTFKRILGTLRNQDRRKKAIKEVAKIFNQNGYVFANMKKVEFTNDLIERLNMTHVLKGKVVFISQSTIYNYQREYKKSVKG